MPISNKLINLLATLRNRTLADGVKWTTGSRGDTFIWSGSAASIVLLTKDSDGQIPWTVRLVDSEGRTVEEETVDGHSDPGLRELVGELYSAARSNALDINATIDGLLDDLTDPF